MSKQMTVKKVLFVLLAVIVLQILITPNTVEAISPSTYRLRVQNLVYTDKGLQAEYVIKEGNVPIADILIKEKGGTIVNLPKGEYALEVVKDPEGWKTVAEAGVISKFSLPYIQSGKAYGDLTITAKATEVKEKFNLKVQTVFYEKGGKPVPVPGVTYTLVDRNTGDYSIILKTGLVTNDKGEISVEGLPKGDYTLLQVGVPDEYILRTAGIDFTITDKNVELLVEVKKETKKPDVPSLPEPEKEKEYYANPYKYGYIPKVVKDTGISVVYDRKYLIGYPEGDFRPNGNMTRAEAATMVVRLIVGKIKIDPVSTNSFKDVPNTAWYKNEVETLKRYKLDYGTVNGNFRPDEKVTRAELMAMLVGQRGVESYKKYSYADIDETHWAKKYIDIATDRGMVNGYEDRTVKPDNPITRAEVSKLVNRYVSRINDEPFIDRVVKTKFEDIKNHWAYYDIINATVDHIVQVENNKETHWISIY